MEVGTTSANVTAGELSIAPFSLTNSNGSVVVDVTLDAPVNLLRTLCGSIFFAECTADIDDGAGVTTMTLFRVGLNGTTPVP